MLIAPARILLKELVELVLSKIMLLLVFVTPVVLVLLIGNVRVREPVLRVAIHIGGPGEAKSVGSKAEELARLFDELSNVSVAPTWKATPDLLERAKRERVDILANWEGGWHFYTPQTHPYRLQFISVAVQNVVISLERSRRALLHLRDLEEISTLVKPPPVQGIAEPARPIKEGGGRASGDAALRDLGAEVLPLVQRMKRNVEQSIAIPVPVIAAALDNEVTRYFPPVSQSDRSAVPGLVSLIAVFTAFLLSSGAFVREREAGMLEVVVLAARRRWLALAAGKLLLPILIAMTSLLLQLLIARSVFSFGFKPGLAGMFVLQFLAVLGSGLLGLSVSALVRSQQQAYLLSAMYLLCLVLVTGYVYPLEQAGVIVRFASYAFPLTFSGPAFEGWLTQGAGLALYGREVMWLAAQCIVAAIVCTAALRRFERTL